MTSIYTFVAWIITHFRYIPSCHVLPQPNAISYNSAIDACGRGEQWQLALALLREMQELGIPQDEVTFGTAVRMPIMLMLCPIHQRRSRK